MKLLKVIVINIVNIHSLGLSVQYLVYVNFSISIKTQLIRHEGKLLQLSKQNIRVLFNLDYCRSTKYLTSVADCENSFIIGVYI